MSIFHMFYDRQGNPIEFLQLAELLEDPNVHRVSKNTFKDGSWLSTVFTGMQLYEDRLRIFETMFFPSAGSPETIGRWDTEEEAYTEHAKALQQLLAQGYSSL
ncbi:hypothetical protein MKY96_33025 [Paenibacillus sp. FSL R7-0302]|uniref:hypothetical protein n=1 Tax=Paenibacillus sp. FSL R7-0302 TaxID=2921681 RepID=UPI0030F50AB3